MKCEKCVEAGQKSRVNSHGGMSTLMGYSPYYDEDGVYHRHDGNRKTNHYSCSNGHHWVEVGTKACPAEGCDFGGVFERREIDDPRVGYPARSFYNDSGSLRIGQSEVIPMAVDRTDGSDGDA